MASVKEVLRLGFRVRPGLGKRLGNHYVSSLG